MATEYFDGIEWEVDDLPSLTWSGDDYDFIQEHEARGVDENGNEVIGKACYTNDKFGSFYFTHVEYEPYEDEEEDYEEDEEW